MITTYPKDIFEKVEFDKILDLVSGYLLGEPAIEVLYAQNFSVDIHAINIMLTQVDEWIKAGENDQYIPLETYESVKEDIPLLKKENYVLSVEAIRRLYKLVHISKLLNDYFIDHTKRKEYQEIYSIWSEIVIDATLMKEIDTVLDDHGEVRPDASPELLKIHKSIRSKERELDSVFASSIKQFGSLGYLADTTESLRNGRRVLTVSAEHKRKIEGVIHDESATGKTVYIEPASVMPINNAIFNLYTEKKKEIYKVLKELCNKLRPFAFEFLKIERVLITLDVIRAKAQLARRMNGIKPEIIDKPYFGFKKAYNPILLLKNEGMNKPTIPFDLELRGANRLVVLSGPNAGGKSITMKSVGVLQLMIQFGLLIPADENSKIGIFKKLFTDIGDQQSIEDDLSTYSSRLQNMKFFLDNVDEDSLVLIDEFGSGTDPKIGGAIAESILRQLNYKKAWGVITTHYSNLKYFAFKSKGILNGSMEFDKEKLRPTYQLIIGKPGSSFAYEIAEKTGLPEKVIKYAKHKTGKNEKAIDELLSNLQAEKKEVEVRMEKLLDKEDKLDKMMKSYNELHKELEFRRKKLKLKQKETKLQEASEENRAIENIIRELKEAKNLEEAKEKAKKLRAKRKLVQQEVVDLQDQVYYSEEAAIDQQIEKGSFVRLRSGGDTGQVISIKKNKAKVQMGFLNMEVPLADLLPAGAPIRYQNKSVNTEGVSKQHNFENKLDIRGYKKSDAEHYVQEFLDKAIINNAGQLKIIHGKGSGVLKKVVMNKIKEYKDVKEVWHPEDEMGGDGVTYIEL